MRNQKDRGYEDGPLEVSCGERKSFHGRTNIIEKSLDLPELRTPSERTLCCRHRLCGSMPCSTPRILADVVREGLDQPREGDLPEDPPGRMPYHNESWSSAMDTEACTFTGLEALFILCSIGDFTPLRSRLKIGGMTRLPLSNIQGGVYAAAPYRMDGDLYDLAQIHRESPWRRSGV